MKVLWALTLAFFFACAGLAIADYSRTVPDTAKVIFFNR